MRPAPIGAGLRIAAAAAALLLSLSACNPSLGEAEKLLKAGDYGKAELLLSGMLSQGANPEARMLLAEARFHTQGPEAALEDLQPLYRDYQDDKDYKAVVARLSAEYGRLDELARSRKPDEIEAYLREEPPHALAERARWLLADLQGKGFAPLAQSDQNLVKQLAQWRAAGSDKSKLEALLKAFPESRLRPAWYAGVVNHLHKSDRDAEAIEVLRRQERELDRQHPRRGSLLLQRAAYAVETRQYAQARQDYLSFLKDFPDHSEGRKAIYAVREKLSPYLTSSDHRFLAQAAYDRWMYQTAYAELAAAGAGDAAGIYRLGDYAREAKLTAEARRHFERLQKGFRGSTEAGLASVGLAGLQRSSKDYHGALNLLELIKEGNRSKPAVVAAALWEEGVIYDFQNRDDLRARAYHELVETDTAFKDFATALWYAIWYDYRQGDYQKVLDTLKKHQANYAGNELESRFKYWQARSLEALKDKEAAQVIYRDLTTLPLMDYYSHRARERLRVIEHGGEDRYATAPYQGYTRERVPDPGYAEGFRKALAGDKEAFSELMELAYLRHPGFEALADDEAAPVYQVLHGLHMHEQGRHYEAITRFRYPAEKDDSYLPVAFPLAFFDTVEKEAKANGLNPFLVSGQIWQESQYKPDIKSWVGATGLMQIMPATGAGIAQNLGLTNYSLTDAATNIRMGTWYLKDRHKVFDGNPLFAVASYNAGAGPVLRWKEQFGHLPYDALAESIPYPETRGYVKRVFTSYWIYQALYGKAE